jgi:hypothetical protein
MQVNKREREREKEKNIKIFKWGERFVLSFKIMHSFSLIIKMQMLHH